MLKTIDALLHPDLLHALASMGHGDLLAIVDRNFPAASVAAETIVGEPLQVSTGLLAAVKAILTVFPLDTFEPEEPAVRGMQVVGDPDAVPDVVAESAPLFRQEGFDVSLIDRFDFYDAAKGCFVIVRTTEDRPYGNFILRKGVV